jgi:formylglycine-generating enzyme
MQKITTFLITVIIFITACSDIQQTEPIKYVDTGVNSDEWAFIAAGSFIKGQYEKETELNYDYEIMITDVTNAQYAAFLNEALTKKIISIKDNKIMGYYAGDEFTAYKHEIEIPPGDWIYMPLDDPGARIKKINETFEVISGYENHPVVLVSWFGAYAYASHYGYRLPTGDEWEKAARGSEDNRPYPWGSGISGDRANFYNSHDPAEEKQNGIGNTTPVGFYNGKSFNGFETVKSVSPYGLYDMAGNVWQWIGDIQEHSHLRDKRGGSKTDHSHNLRIWTISTVGPEYTGPSIGFRCVRTP